jgi:hypothetical protein
LGCEFEFTDQQIDGPHETKHYNAHFDSFKVDEVEVFKIIK